MRIIIGADCVATQENFEEFVNANTTALVGEELENILRSADMRIFNLELALANEDTPIRKGGVALRAPTAVINGYRALGIDLLGISNNHMLDHGYDGLRSTINTLDQAKIAHVGGGFSQKEAAKPYIFEKEGKKIGVYACCEHEFSWARDYGYGANGFDPFDSLDEIAALKAECDYVIVLYHGGKEHYRYPSPYLRKVCRKIVDKGADIVLCQHTHCIGAEEDYHGGKIIYGQGNFIFVKNREEYPFEGWWTGMLVAVDIADEGVSYEYIPYEATDKGVKLSSDPSLLEGLRSRSEEIKDEAANAKMFAEYAAKTIPGRYLKHMSSCTVDDEFITRYGKAIFHYIECEVHHEMLHIGLKYRLGYDIYGELGGIKKEN